MLTTKQKAVNYETIKHIQAVQSNILRLVYAVLERGQLHDQTKLEEPEVEYFVKFTERLHGLSYPSQEYNESLKDLAPALTHHYANSRHHPEHFKNGVEDMNLVDVLEMFCDWVASAKRQDDGNLRMSLAENGERFKINPQLLRVFENTLDLLER